MNSKHAAQSKEPGSMSCIPDASANEHGSQSSAGIVVGDGRAALRHHEHSTVDNPYSQPVADSNRGGREGDDGDRQVSDRGRDRKGSGSDSVAT